MLHHLLAADPASAGSTGTAATIFAILASAVIVLGGLAALVRAIWKTATTLRDNTTATRDAMAATKALTDRLDGLARSVDGRIDSLAERVGKLERAAGN